MNRSSYVAGRARDVLPWTLDGLRAGLRRLAVLAALLLALPAAAQTGTAFGFQGRLYEAGVQAQGQVQLRITPWDAGTSGVALAASLETGPLDLVDGVFSTRLDFGPAVFLGTPVWLAIEADTGSGYVLLEPRQPVTPTPYAMHAATVAVDGVDQFALQDGAVGTAKIAPGAVGAAQVDSSDVQLRIASGCAAGMAIAAVAADGSASCVPTAGGDGGWSVTGNGTLHTDSRVRVGGLGATAPKMIVHANSTISAPQLELRETELDYARLNFASAGAIDGGGFHDAFWSIAARTRPAAEGGPATDQMNFFNSRGGDAMTLYGNGWLGLGAAAFTPDAPLMVTSNGLYAPGIGPQGRGDLYIGDGAVGLSFGVATGGGGAGATRIWTDGGLVDQLFLGSANHGDVLAIKDDRVGIGLTDPVTTLDVAGGARVRGLADATAEGNRIVQVEPDGDLTVGGASPRWLSVAGSAFLPGRPTSPQATRLYTELSVDPGETGALHAPLVLPDGARVTAMRLYMRDNVSGDYYLRLLLGFIDATGEISLMRADTAGADPAMRSFESTEAPFVVNNELYTYVLTLSPKFSTTWQGDASLVRGVRLRVE